MCVIADIELLSFKTIENRSLSLKQKKILPDKSKSIQRIVRARVEKVINFGKVEMGLAHFTHTHTHQSTFKCEIQFYFIN